MKKNKVYISKRPIGIFDSGLGGLSICKEIVNVLPNESIIYLADSANTPYGEKNKEEIIALSIKNTEFLLALGCKIIVVACNTATTNAIAVLREKYNIPFIGIEPAIKPAALQTRSRKIGVLATKGTLSSDLFISNSNLLRKQLEIIEVEGANLVRLIENGQLEETKSLLNQYLIPMIEQGVDNIVLGCTHYPFLIPIIRELIPIDITIIDSGKAVAKQTLKILEFEGLLNQTSKENSHFFYTNNSVDLLSDFLKIIELRAEVIAFKKF